MLQIPFPNCSLFYFFYLYPTTFHSQLYNFYKIIEINSCFRFETTRIRDRYNSLSLMIHYLIDSCFRSLTALTKNGYKFYSLNSNNFLETIFETGKFDIINFCRKYIIFRPDSNCLAYTMVLVVNSVSLNLAYIRIHLIYYQNHCIS